MQVGDLVKKFWHNARSTDLENEIGVVLKCSQSNPDIYMVHWQLRNKTLAELGEDLIIYHQKEDRFLRSKTFGQVFRESYDGYYEHQEEEENKWMKKNSLIIYIKRS